MPAVRLRCGTIEYRDTGDPAGDDRRVIVLLHGLIMDSSVFDPVIELLREDYRCISPTLPLGSHRIPMNHDADLSLDGFGRMLGEFLERLDLHDVTLVQNDHAAALVLAGQDPTRIGRLVISPCEAFENYPPGLPGKNAALLARFPGGLYPAMQLMRIRQLRRLPIALGWMAKHPLSDSMVDRWFEPVQSSRAIRRDLAKYAGAARKRQMAPIMERLRSFQKPTLILWATEDRVMPADHGRRFAELLPNAQLIHVRDSYTLMPLDQPEVFARHIREFAGENAHSSGDQR